MRKYIDAFGSLFNNLYVVRYNADTTENHRAKVPIQYGPKEKWLVRTVMDPLTEKGAAIVLPRMGFEIVQIHYAPERKTPNNLKFRLKDPSSGSNSSMYNAVPYDVHFNLYVIAKSVDEDNQVVEQILPMFTPDFNLSVKTIPELDLTPDICISLIGVSPSDTYEGTFERRREIIWTLQFVLKGYFYGPIRSSKIILDSKVNFYGDLPETEPEKIETIHATVGPPPGYLISVAIE